MEKKVKIGLVWLGSGLLRVYMKSKYSQSVRRAGAIPVWLPWTSDAIELAKDCEMCDGFIFPGGADIDPIRYGEEKTALCEEICAPRDVMEFALLQLALAAKKPVLGVCRGLQLLNVALGGTLYQDINGLPGVKEEQHSDFKHRGTSTHSVRLEEDSLLFQITEKKQMNVNSIHHQAIQKLADGLVATAYSEAGVIEAVELRDTPFCVGVQWHPEHLSATRDDQQAIFNALVAMCKISNH
ncbi:MAG: gamma-glutamyl-gamma-aminobutyrate hydrolase family protein [Ruthenibacterium sp.]